MNADPPRHGARAKPYFLLLILCNLMWAFQYTGAKIATRQLGPITVTFLPMAAATILLGLLLLARRGRKNAKSLLERGSFLQQLLNFVALGVVGCVLSQFCITAGIKRSLASNASIITLTIPVLTALLATLLVGEKMSRLLWVSFALAIAGVLLVSDVDWHTVQIFHGKYLVGNVLILAGCFGSGFYNAFSKRLLRTFTPLEVVFYSFLVADVALFFAMLSREPLSRKLLMSLGPAVWLSLAMIAIFSLSMAMMLFFWVIDRINLTQAALSIYLLPVFGVLISTLTLKEKIRWQLVAGGLLVFVGTLLATRYEGRKSAREPSEQAMGSEG
ncbi:MAG: DMT family transporter [Acidobacteriota bacterium]|nr:DMT family transporter [Acidobacteriota bacterium]